MKRILITGSNGGIGSNLCENFNNMGYEVYGIDIDIQNESMCDNYIQLDLKNPDWEKLPKEKFDVLICNAATQILKPFNDFTDEDISNSFNVNLINIFKLIQKIKLSENSSVINMGSIHSSQTKKNFSLYAATKGGLETLTKSLSIELSPYTRVNMIKPAAIETQMLKSGLSEKSYNDLKKYHPTNSIGTSDNIFDIIFAVINNDFINGSIISIDGGISNVLNDPN